MPSFSCNQAVLLSLPSACLFICFLWFCSNRLFILLE